VVENSIWKLGGDANLVRVGIQVPTSFLVQALDKLETSAGAKSPAYLSTHPATKGRILEAERLASHAERLRELSGCGQTMDLLQLGLRWGHEGS
jgi:predicted Zn-dependent protease